MSLRPAYASPSHVPLPASDKQLCAYVAETCMDLRRLAQRPKFRTLSYLLDMVRLEAEKMGRDLPD